MALRDALNRLTGRTEPAAEPSATLQQKLDAATAEVQRCETEHAQAALAVEEGDEFGAARLAKSEKALQTAQQRQATVRAALVASQVRDRAQAAADAAAAVRADDEARAAAHARMVKATEAADVAMTAAVQAVDEAAGAMRAYAATTGNATEVVSCIASTCASIVPILKFRLADADVPGVHRPSMLLREHTVLAGRLPRLIVSTTLRRSA